MAKHIPPPAGERLSEKSILLVIDRGLPARIHTQTKFFELNLRRSTPHPEPERHESDRMYRRSPDTNYRIVALESK